MTAHHPLETVPTITWNTQAGHCHGETVQVMGTRGDERFEIGERTRMRNSADPRLQRCQPERMDGTHRIAEDAHTVGIDPVDPGQKIQRPAKLRQHLAEQCPSLIKMLFRQGLLAITGTAPEAGHVERKCDKLSTGQGLAIGFGKQGRPVLDEFAGTNRVPVAMRVAIEDCRPIAPLAVGPGKDRPYRHARR